MTIGFNRGDPSKTDQLIYMAAGDGSVSYTRYVKGDINSEAQLDNIEEWEITDKAMTKVKKTDGNSGSGDGWNWKEYLSCVGGNCAMIAVGCVLSNCGYLACLGTWCAAAALGCGVQVLISNL